MELEPGTRIGPCEIIAKIGEGGMGLVYQARDTRLDRHVAIKVLPDALAQDADRLARFEREAKVLASLNHPNIAQVYGFEERAIVMEFVEGPTLADLIATGPLPLNDALAFARQIAEALGAAHELGIIHRDLKPANVKVKDDGSVKVLDFGLAKALGPDASESGASGAAMNSPTLTARATQLGMILGTAAYMAPEQAKGRAVDRRADVWAFGVVLFEMLAGRRAFEGDDVSEVLASVLKLEPAWDALPADLPGPVRRLLRRCLEKDPKRRLRDVGEGMLQLDESLASGSTTSMMMPAIGDAGQAPAPAAVSKPLWRRALPIAAAVVITAAAMAAANVFMRAPASPADPIQFSYASEAATSLWITSYSSDELAISPDGSTLVWAGGGAATPGLRIGRFDGSGSVALRGAEGAVGPFVSPDNDWVGFVSTSNTRELVKVAIVGGARVSLATAKTEIIGATWTADSDIIFGTADGGLFAVPEGGGVPTTLTTLDQGELRHIWPSAIPGTNAVLFVTSGTGAPISSGQLAVLDRRSGRIERLKLTGSHPRYVPSGHIAYATADGSITAVAFDARRLQVTGIPVPIIQNVGTKQVGAAEFDVATDGRLVYATGGAAGAERTISWLDRTGRETPMVSPKRAYVYARISPTDGGRLSLDIRDQELDVWTLDSRGALTRLTSSDGSDQYGLWTPDGQRVILFSSASGNQKEGLYAVQADGTGRLDLLYAAPEGTGSPFPNAVSPDGKSVIFRAVTNGKNDLYLLRLDGDRAVTPLVATEHDEVNAAFSPDGRWIVYQSDLSGRDMVYVRPFPDVNASQFTLSTGGGVKPVWSPSGREVFYLSDDDKLMSVGVDTTRGFSAAAPVPLFDVSAYFRSAVGRNYDVAADGKRFVMIKNPANAAAGLPFTVVLNWATELRRRAPAK